MKFFLVLLTFVLGFLPALSAAPAFPSERELKRDSVPCAGLVSWINGAVFTATGFFHYTALAFGCSTVCLAGRQEFGDSLSRLPTPNNTYTKDSRTLRGCVSDISPRISEIKSFLTEITCKQNLTALDGPPSQIDSAISKRPPAHVTKRAGDWCAQGDYDCSLCSRVCMSARDFCNSDEYAREYAKSMRRKEPDCYAEYLECQASCRKTKKPTWLAKSRIWY